MATIRELRASFVAKANSMKSTIRGVKKEVDGLQSTTDKASDKMSKSTGGISKHFHNLSVKAQKSFDSIGNTLQSTGKKLDSFGSGLKQTGNSLTNKITKPATAAVGALAGLALVKGFGRLVGIDTAQAKLKGLGHDAESVEKIMGSAMDAVKGTSFGMDEAATTAASAVAAGIEPGKELTRYLSLTGDAAAIAGSSMSEMGSIINQVQTSQVAYTDNLNQLSDRGIPIYQWLGEEAGVAASEVKEMASEGKISSEMFLKAIENNIGGASQKIGEESFTAGIANMWAAVGRLGASFLDAGGKGGGFFSQLKPLIADLTENLDGMGDFAEKAGEKLGEMFASFVDKVKSVKSAYDDLSPTVQQIINKVALVGGAVAVGIGPVLTVIGLLVGAIGKALNPIGGFFKVISKGIGFISGKSGMTGALKTLGSRFSFLAGPVGIVIGIITTLASIFTVAYKKSETFRNFVDKLKDAFVEAYKKVKEFLTTNESFLGFIDSIKNGFSTAKDLIVQAFGAAMDFVKEKISDIKKFWDSNGAQLLQSFQNIFSGIWKVAEPIINALVSAVQFAFPFIKKTIEIALKLALAIVKMIWSNIKGVIDGALNIIMGAVKVFSGLFTGDWSKMWEGIKQVLSGAVQFIWNFIQLSFFGKILKGGLAFVKSFAGFFSTMWTGIKNTFSTVIKWIVDFVKNRFTSMGNTISNLTTGIQNFLSKIWNFIWNGIFKPIIKGIYDFVRGRFTSLRDTVSSIFSGIRDTARSTWNKIKDNIINPVRDGVKWSLDKFGEFKSKVATTFSNIKDDVSGYVSDMIQKVKDMPGNMKDKLVDGAGKLKDGALELGRKMVDGIADAVNGVGKAVNWVAKKLGLDDIVGTWKPEDKLAWYAHGTKGHPGGDAVLGDGTGNNSGSELVSLPNGQSFLSADKPTIYQDLPKGTKVLPAKKTRELLSNIPMYANGVGDFFGKVGNGIKNGVGKAKDATVAGYNKAKDTAVDAGKKVAEWTGDVWDYVKNPGKLLDIALKKVGAVMPDGVGAMADLAKGAFKTIKGKAVDWVKEQLSFGGGEGVGVAPSGGASAWRIVVKKAAAEMNETVTDAEVAGIIAQIQRESGGNEKIVQSSAVWDVNTAAGNPARGLLQYIPQTFAAYKVPGHNNIYSGYDQLLAFFNNRNWRKDLPYGKRGWGPTGGRKYKQGTNYVPEDGPAYLHKGEAVIPAEYNRPAKSPDVLNLIGKRLGLSEETIADYQGRIVNGLSIVQELIRVQTQEIINQNPFLSRMVDGVRNARETLSNQIKEAKQAINNGMDSKKNELSNQAQANTDKSLKRFNQVEKSLSGNIDKTENSLSKQLGRKAGEIISIVSKSINTMGSRIEKATGQAVSKLETKIKSVETKAVKAQKIASQVQKNAKKSKQSAIVKKVNQLRSGSSAADKYFKAIEEDGDWLNDWSTHLGSKKQQKPYLLAGYDYAKSLGFKEGKYAQKHLNRIKGYADGGIVDMKQLAWIAEGGWAESIISHDPAKRLSQQRIWKETGNRLGFTDDKGSKEMLSELRRIARTTEQLIKVTKEGKTINIDGNEVAEVMYGPFKQIEAVDEVGRYFD
ncbi:tape measure protein [Oceanobacillus sp. J11TS1]|uniref:tape measure protein n=1 Tax=Oceanobacillus sp. J11TS1 TaxID=2807191 RepID=UPI001B2E198E|nr:tape measure protein [Oceanobacillus sp. J11TS1]GIO25091.1 hypothetical protein J11TS1_36720 [Oceanobacillus sp. J11TS1]